MLLIYFVQHTNALIEKHENQETKNNSMRARIKLDGSPMNATMRDSDEGARPVTQKLFLSQQAQLVLHVTRYPSVEMVEEGEYKTHAPPLCYSLAPVAPEDELSRCQYAWGRRNTTRETYSVLRSQEKRENRDVTRDAKAVGGNAIRAAKNNLAHTTDLMT